MLEHQGTDAKCRAEGEHDCQDQDYRRHDGTEQHGEDEQDHDQDERDDNPIVVSRCCLDVLLDRGVAAHQTIGVDLLDRIAHPVDRGEGRIADRGAGQPGLEQGGVTLDDGGLHTGNALGLFDRGCDCLDFAR